MEPERVAARSVSQPHVGASVRGFYVADAERVRVMVREGLRPIARQALSARVVEAAIAAVEQVRLANQHGVSTDEAHWLAWSAQVSLEKATRYAHRLVGEFPYSGPEEGSF